MDPQYKPRNLMYGLPENPIVQTSGKPVSFYLEKYRLHDAWKRICQRQAENPYHGCGHLYATMSAAIFLAESSGHDPHISLIAAMFHDAGHTGKTPDSINVNRSVFEFYMATNPQQGPKLLHLTETEILLVAGAIQSTLCINGSFPIDPVNPYECIMRDADLWNPHLSPRNALHLIRAVGVETGGWNHDTTVDGILKTLDFFENVTWWTETANNMKLYVHRNLNILLRRYEALDETADSVQDILKHWGHYGG